MKLFSLTVDFAFKALFAPNPDLLVNLLNSFPSFKGNNRIVSLKVLNPEIPKELSDEKLSILDIKAENENGEQFLIEMQAFPQSSFTKRALYYWSKVYSKGLRKGQDYEELKKVYSINFVKHSIWKDHPEYLSTFRILENTRNFPLTEDLEIHNVELEKFLESFESLETDLESWIYLLKESQNLKGESMKTLEKKSPEIKKAISELKNISRSPKSRELYEARRKAELDYNSGMKGAFRQGKEEGLEEGLLLGIRMNLKSRFNLREDDPILKEIHRIKDLDRLTKILTQSVQAKTLEEFKKFIKSIK